MTPPISNPATNPVPNPVPTPAQRGSGGVPDGERPVAGPTAWSTPAPERNETQASAPASVRFGAGNMSSPHVPSSAPQPVVGPVVGRVGARGLQKVAEGLSRRDREILNSVAEHRFLTTRHVEALHFTGHATPLAAARATRRVLYRLSSLNLITHLDRRVGGVRAGSASYIWRVGVIGDRLLRQASSELVRQRAHEPSERFLQHCLAVADAHVALAAAHRAGLVELLRVELEPACWRSYLGPGGERRSLQPDLHVVTGAREFEDHWFLEIDLGTEHLPTVIRKCRQYEAYRRTGREQHAHGVFPVVVWVVPDDTRANKINGALQAVHDLDRSAFRVTTLGGLVEVLRGGAA